MQTSLFPEFLEVVPRTVVATREDGRRARRRGGEAEGGKGMPAGGRRWQDDDMRRCQDKRGRRSARFAVA